MDKKDEPESSYVIRSVVSEVNFLTVYRVVVYYLDF